MKHLFKTGLAVFIVLILPLPLFALDTGPLIFGKDIESKSVLLEIGYTNQNRDLDITSNTITIQGQDYDFEEDTAENKAKMFYGKLSVFATPNITFNISMGMDNVENTKTTPITVGAGIKYLAYSKDKFNLGFVFDGIYVPEFKFKDQEEYDPAVGWVKYSNSKQYFYEINAGLLGSYSFGDSKRIAFVPYGGLELSFFRGEENGYLSYVNYGISGETKTKVSEDQIIDAVIGASLIMKNLILLRAEGRLIGEETFSANIGVIF
jgi:hypothetical protein